MLVKTSLSYMKTSCKLGIRSETVNLQRKLHGFQPCELYETFCTGSFSVSRVQLSTSSMKPFSTFHAISSHIYSCRITVRPHDVFTWAFRETFRVLLLYQLFTKSTQFPFRNPLPKAIRAPIPPTTTQSAPKSCKNIAIPKNYYT